MKDWLGMSNGYLGGYPYMGSPLGRGIDANSSLYQQMAMAQAQIDQIDQQQLANMMMQAQTQARPSFEPSLNYFNPYQNRTIPGQQANPYGTQTYENPRQPVAPRVAKEPESTTVRLDMGECEEVKEPKIVGTEVDL